jgi:hypothetical protein
MLGKFASWIPCITANQGAIIPQPGKRRSAATPVISLTNSFITRVNTLNESTSRICKQSRNALCRIRGGSRLAGLE